MNLYYYWGIIRKLSLAKVSNLALLYSGYWISALIKKPYQRGQPFSASIEPTTACNLRCSQCPSGLRSFSRPTGMIDPTLFRETILQLKRHLHTLVFYFQGEPYLHPEFLDMVQFASGHKIYTMTSTNGHFMNTENARATVMSGLDRLIISVDGISQKSYSAYRTGGSLEKVLSGTKELIKARRMLNKRTPYIIWQCIAFKSNESDISGIKKLGKALGVD